MATEKRGFIAFFATYRPPVPLDIYSCPLDPPPKSIADEIHWTDPKELESDNYNYNGQQIPPAALKTILNRPKLVSLGLYKDADVDSGRLSGFLFVSERGDYELETLHIALRFNDSTQPKVKVFSLADIYGTTTFGGVRMEDSGCVAGDYLIYVTTKDPAPKRRQPWTAVYKTNLNTGETERLTPPGEADLSPSVSPSGRKIAVASFEGKDRGWDGEIENLETNIYVFDIDNPIQTRYKVVTDGGWPTWGSEDVLFFHRKVGDYWGVFRADIGGSLVPPVRITPEDITAITPAAINGTTVAVATIRQKSSFNDVRVEDQYRHIEIFEYSATSGETVSNIKITQNTRPLADHFNPFVIDVIGENKRIGYHRCRTIKSQDGITRRFHKLKSADPAIQLVRVPGVFPTFSEDGSKLAFVDNEFKAVWLADASGLRVVYDAGKPNSLFATVWNRNPEKDTLYVCVGPAFSPNDKLDIAALINVSTTDNPKLKTLTTGDFNNAFASTNIEGTQLVYRSTRNGGSEKYKNLYIMDAQSGEDGCLTRLTEGKWTDTHCQWSPNGDWIVFSSSRENPYGADQYKKENFDNGLDPGYFAVYLVNTSNPSAVVRVAGSGYDLAGHVNHPFFSPDGKSIVVTSDLAAVSVDPTSLPLFVHSVRPYGDVFIFDFDCNDMNQEDLKTFKRATHSRFEYSTVSWTSMFPPVDMDAQWNLQRYIGQFFAPTCPYVHPGGGESWHMTGQLCIAKRDC
ncbi:hypothetical protein L484_024689 [Morus notabilis]|uniref:Protein tolB n=1 Tax=Morus notabilis TaxID=981085 RepID=W9RT69_9ROSA|nr:uncharacterized protein LOC21407422 [Morus notabilis]EXB68674.1 hypothetical protein L484_024689 [Morus notabilis]